MAKTDLTNMSMEELKALAKDVDQALKTYEERKLREARTELEAKARELGVSLEAVMGKGSGPKRSKAPAKYRHPENPEKTWTGRGRSPKWITEHEANGGSRDDFLIK